MEDILSKLSEIEITAQRIMEEADKTKKTLSEEMEKQCKDFDTILNQETEEKIQEIRRGLEKNKDQELSALRQNMENASAALDGYFRENHEKLSEEIFQKIIHR